VNNNDIVTRMPPAWFGYRHGGQEVYLNRHGKIQKLKGWRRVKDRLRGVFAGLRRFRVDYLSDHSMLQYIDNIFQNQRSGKTPEL
jgi:triacylglycerol lipase